MFEGYTNIKKINTKKHNVDIVCKQTMVNHIFFSKIYIYDVLN